MVSAGEAAGQQGQSQSTLEQGVNLISAEQQVQFRRYTRVVLEQDGYVFWVATPEYTTVKGSLHYATERHQDQDQTIGANQIMLTSEGQINEFNVVSPNSMWIGDWPTQEDAPPLKIAFVSRGNFYKQADLWHYFGFAVFPVLMSQLIENAADLPAGPIVSNSLPIWLTLNNFAGVTVPVYPSFLVPDNLRPPYIAVHIHPDSTESLAAAPYFGPAPGDPIPNSGTAPFYALAVSTPARDTVELVLFGFSSQLAWQYLTMLYESSTTSALFGFANSPVPQDEKRTQPEIAAIAQKKIITILANYNQGAADAVARRLILEAGVTISVIGGVATTGTGSLVQNAQTLDGEGMVIE